MRCLLVPRAIFLPVARRDLFPRVVEVDCLLEILHCEIVCAVMWIRVMCVVAAMLRVAAIRKSWFDGIGRWAAIAFEWVLGGLSSVKGAKGLEMGGQRPKSKPCAGDKRSSGKAGSAQRFSPLEPCFSDSPQSRLGIMCGVKSWRNNALSQRKKQGSRGCLIC
jgi:hypothetical protein